MAVGGVGRGILGKGDWGEGERSATSFWTAF